MVVKFIISVASVNYYININNICCNKFICCLDLFIKLNSFPVYLILVITVYVLSYMFIYMFFLIFNVSCILCIRYNKKSKKIYTRIFGETAYKYEPVKSSHVHTIGYRIKNV